MNPNNPYQPQPENPPTPPSSSDGVPPTPNYQQPPPSYPPNTPQYDTTPPQYYQPQQTPYQQPYSPPSQNQAPPPEPSYTPPPRPKRYDKLPLPVRMMDWAKKNWWAPVLGVVVLLLVAQIVYQFAFPANALPPGTIVDGQEVGGRDRQEVVTALNKAYGKVKTDIYFGSTTVPYKTPEARELGIEVDNSDRLADVSYPVWLRLVPSSIMWASSLNSIDEPLYNYDKTTLDNYVLSELGADCTIEPKNATIKLDDGRFTPVPSVPGGKCNVIDFKDKVSQTKLKDGKMSVRTDINEVAAPVTEGMAKKLADTLNENLQSDMPLVVAGKTQKVPARTVKGWLSFKSVVPEASEEGGVVPPARIEHVVEPERVRTYFDSSIASGVEKKPGVTKISTKDFTVTSQKNGKPGVLINMKKTIASINEFVLAKSKQARVSVGPVPATVQYTRSYTPSNTGMRALIAQFSQDNKGRIAIMMQEDSGKDPLLGGTARQNEVFEASGIEGAYVAYAAQLGIENGSIQPTDRIAGSSSVEDCVEAAIKDQDSDCIAALLQKVGNATATQRLRSIGLTKTSFSGRTNTTTAKDAYTFMVKMRSKDTPLKNKGDLEKPMKDIRMRDGIVKSGGRSVTAIGGESERFYNEAATISQKGVYHIAILSEGSDGAKTVNKLVQAIEKLRAERQALKKR